MENSEYPEAGKPLIFTDMQGIVRRGIYKSDRHGFQEIGEVEIPVENEFVFPEDDIVSWDYTTATGSVPE
jgi:hypothetical protein